MEKLQATHYFSSIEPGTKQEHNNLYMFIYMYT